mgnify:CR=1 FL=1
MCGIAGLIHRGKSSKVGHELQGMLQALKHRGEDSTGYALYGDTDGKNFIMRFKVGENVGEGSTSVAEDVSVYDERKKIVDGYLSEMGAKIVKEERILPYSLRYEIQYDKKDLLEFSQKIESIPGVEILSMGKSLEVIKDLGNAKMVCDRYNLGDVGRYKLNKRLGLGVDEDQVTLTKEDILTITRYVLDLKNNKGNLDDINSLSNRRIRGVGELMGVQLRTGLVKIERNAKEKTM